MGEAAVDSVPDGASRVNAVVPHATLPRILGAAGRRLERTARRALLTGRGRRAVATLPQALRPAALWALGDTASAAEEDLAERVEQARARIARRRQRIRSYHSPLPGTFTTDDSGAAVPGPVIAHQARAHAQTGSRPKKGILLQRLSVGSEAARILELGTNTGLSASYLASSPTLDLLLTIEGSPGLSAIARRTLAQFTDRAEVRTALFDDALATLAEEPPFDLAFIDGQHEGAATLHYDARVRPLMQRDGGIVVFDDIYWSRDMLAAWHSIIASGSYALTLDLGSVGVGVLGTDAPHHVDLMRYVGRPHVPRRVGDARVG